MVYVQYYNHGKISPNLEGYTEAMGDRGIVILDGRNSLDTLHHDAKAFNGYRRPVYLAYRLFKGNSLLDSQPISSIIPLT